MCSSRARAIYNECTDYRCWSFRTVVEICH
jgi:hypothetical protein